MFHLFRIRAGKSFSADISHTRNSSAMRQSQSQPQSKSKQRSQDQNEFNLNKVKLFELFSLLFDSFHFFTLLYHIILYFIKFNSVDWNISQTTLNNRFSSASSLSYLNSIFLPFFSISSCCLLSSQQRSGPPGGISRGSGIAAARTARAVAGSKLMSHHSHHRGSSLSPGSGQGYANGTSISTSISSISIVSPFLPFLIFTNFMVLSAFSVYRCNFAMI